jgi:hypothetical protein
MTMIMATKNRLAWPKLVDIVPESRVFGFEVMIPMEGDVMDSPFRQVIEGLHREAMRSREIERE